MHRTGQEGADGAGSAGEQAQHSPAGGSGLILPRSARTNLPVSRDTDMDQVSRARAELGQAKAELRGRVLAARRAMSASQRDATGRDLRDVVLALPEMQMAGTVASYMSVGTEPGTRGLIFALWKRGTYVLLPVLLEDGDLDWATYEGPDSLVPGPRGLLQPTEARRGVTAVTSADVVIVPALAVDGTGRRLGRGGGSYDRALARVGTAVLTVALLYDGELIAQVPADARDQPVRAAAMPRQGISRLG